jgi:hypothetical protein
MACQELAEYVDPSSILLVPIIDAKTMFDGSHKVQEYKSHFPNKAKKIRKKYENRVELIKFKYVASSIRSTNLLIPKPLPIPLHYGVRGAETLFFFSYEQTPLSYIYRS